MVISENTTDSDTHKQFHSSTKRQKNVSILPVYLQEVLKSIQRLLSLSWLNKIIAIMMPGHILPFPPSLHVIKGGVSCQKQLSEAVLTDLVFSGISHEKKRALWKMDCGPCLWIICASVDFSGNHPTKERAPLLQAQQSNPASLNNVKTIWKQWN